ncbi:hypothetical protein [Mucilaginibacter celer]|uniref:Glycerophosphoryl diester phosphodiesterase membrane domain-containing protein n=1 Tax=Mucilaginibacter celer TaxID=2305508 RepID=A0A494VR90_9SPHI|nr:hypothetical protein [Mucilaginibacter celer]AYL97424.1 hypothetical protein HYN43_019870 [Mucilaginibacter celer]
MKPPVELAKTRDFSETISDTFTFVKQNIKPLFKAFFVFSGFFLVAGTISAVFFQMKMVNLANGVMAPGPVANLDYGSSFFERFGIEYFITILLYMITLTVLKVTTFSYVAIYKEKGNLPPTTEEVWGYIKYYFWRILGASFVSNILLVIGFVFCFIPGVYLAPIFALIFPIIVFENASFGYAFNRCFTLIKDNWWLTFGILLVTWIIIYACITAITLPAALFNVIGMVMHPQKGTNLSMTASVLTVVLQHLCLVFLIIPIVTISLCYFNLTESKEGTNLLERISKLGEIKPENDLPAEEY